MYFKGDESYVVHGVGNGGCAVLAEYGNHGNDHI